MKTHYAFAVVVAALGLIPGGLRIASADPKAARTAEPNYTRVEDVIYGRRDGSALTMDVFTSKGESNGAGIVVVVSAEYRSGRELLGLLHPLGTAPLLDAGYVVFAVMHSAQPKYTVPAAIEDLHRAVRFVKANAKNYGVDPDKLGAAGASSGGQLALMMGCAGKVGAAGSIDPVERQSSRVSAVGCFFPPTDFAAIAATCPEELSAPFDFRELDAKCGRYRPVSAERRLRIGAEISPITHAAKDSAPALIIHGDRDKLVPISQAKAMIAKLKASGAECELVVKAGKGHGWFGMQNDIPALVAWFDRHLLGKK